MNKTNLVIMMLGLNTLFGALLAFMMNLDIPGLVILGFALIGIGIDYIMAKEIVN